MSKSEYTPPLISISEDLDSGELTLMATSYGQTMPAGPRLFRGYPHPGVRFTHSEYAAAERDAAALRTYLAECASGKRKDRAPVGRGWWQG